MFQTKPVGPEGTNVQGQGVTVQVPAGAVPAGQQFTVGIGQPLGHAGNEGFGIPIHVDHAAALSKPVRVSWDVSALSAEQRSTIVLVHWDPTTSLWRVAKERATLDGTTLTADVTEFSFIDWVSGGAATISQTVGQWSGKRADAPKCSGASLPGWVSNVVRPDEDQPAMPIRTCVEPDKNNVLTVRVANNRPYTQTLDLTKGDRYAWTWAGEQDYTVAGILRDLVNGLLSTDKTFVIAPTRATAVGLARPSTPGQVQLMMTAQPTVATVAEDIIVYLLENGLGVDNVGGFDSETINKFAQALYDCGGKQVLKSRDVVGADTFQKVLETVHSCAENDSVRTAIEDVLRAQIAKGGKSMTNAIKTNRILHEVLGKLGIYLQVADFSSYVAELSSSGAIGDVNVSVFGTGTPSTLGAWTPTCLDADADSGALYKNLALQDAFTDKSKELWQFPTWATSSVKAVTPLAKCSGSHREAVAVNVESTWADKKAAAVVANSIRALTGSKVTEVVTVNILSGGRLKPGYTVEDQRGGDPEDCTYDEGSPAGTTPNTHSCGSVAAYMAACWADPSVPRAVLCLDQGWEKAVRRLTVTGLHLTPKPDNPTPLSVELVDGSRWYLRLGGAWDAVPEGYVPTYGCIERCSAKQGEYGRVLVAASEGPDTFDTSKPLWTALIAQTGNDPSTLPPPTKTPVARVWFVAAD